MKLSRILVILGGLAGVIALFMPLFKMPIEAGGKKYTAEMTGLQSLTGVSAISDVVKGDDLPKGEDDKAAVADMNKSWDSARWIFYTIFGSALLLFLVGATGRLGRGKASLAMLLGIVAGLGAWLLIAAMANVSKDRGVDVPTGLAVTLLLVAAGGGCLGGLIGLISPERKPSSPSA